MKEQLITLAKEKKFTSKIIGKSVEATHSTKDFYYLWMCELQKWFREEHQIHISITIFEDNTWAGDLIHEGAEYEWNDLDAPYDAENCNSYEEVLEICLIKALQMI